MNLLAVLGYIFFQIYSQVMSLKMKKNTIAQLAFFVLVFGLVACTAGKQKTVPVNVGVVLDMGTSVGKMGLRFISMALKDFYASGHGQRYRTRLVLHLKDSKGTVVGAAAAALDLIQNVEVQAIIGPVTSIQANFLINLGDQVQVPIISFSATSPLLSSIHSPYFIRAALDDSSQVKPITAVVKSFNWSQVAIVYVDDEYGEGLVPFFMDALHKVNIDIAYKSKIPRVASDNQIVEELNKLKGLECRVFIVHMNPSLGSRFFSKAQELEMMTDGYVWILTDGITNSFYSMDPIAINAMQGVLGVKPHIRKSKSLEDVTNRWKMKGQKKQTMTSDGLGIYGLWAYDAATALAMAVEKIGFTSNLSTFSQNATDYLNIGASQMGKKLAQALRDTRFRGLSGSFNIVNGQLQPSDFEIVNVIGNSGRGVGYWTPENGISRELSIPIRRNEKYTTSSSNLKGIIWPGDTVEVPRGWDVTRNRKNLRIAVPVKDGLSDFVRVTKNSLTNETDVVGYCKDVFDAAREAMSYQFPYEFVPFAKPDGKSAGDFDDLLHEVSIGNYDAVLGDVTITSKRSSLVDFTVPYIDSGVTMIVPFKENKFKNAWIFLKPLTRDLWLISFAFFVFIGLVVWILEHQINDDFSGPSLHQVGTSFWFSFSPMVFANKDKIVGNLARFVIIVWCFVILILTQSYTASLTSLLTVQRLEPSVTDVRELIMEGKNVGYPKGSFVLGFLKRMNFKDSQLKVYNTMDDLNLALANRSIAAAFDEIPYLRVFLRRHPSNYTMVAPTYRTGGFAFALRKGSALLPDMSRAILEVMEKERMEQIETAWIGQQISYGASYNTTSSSSSLSFGSFWGLFLIVGVAASFAIVIFLAMLLYEHRKTIFHINLFSFWRRKSEREETGEETLAAASVQSCPRLSNDDVTDEEGLVSLQEDGTSSSVDVSSHHYSADQTPSQAMPSHEISDPGDDSNQK